VALADRCGVGGPLTGGAFYALQMRIAIAGSSGSVGSALAAVLGARGDDVIRLTRPQSHSVGVPWDPERGSIDGAALEGLDGVVNLAGRSIGDHRWTRAEQQRLWSSRVDSTRFLASTLASLERPPAVLVSASAVGYYGDGGESVLDEMSPAGSGFLADLCVAWEAANGPASDAGIRTAQLRSGIVLSASGGALGRLLAPFGPGWISPFRWGLGGPVAGGRQWWSWISLDDEIRAILHILDAGSSGPVNLVSPTPVTNREFTKALGRVLRRPTIMPIPGFVLRILLGSDLAKGLVLDGQRVLPTLLTGSGFEFNHRDIDAGLGAALTG
jgi:uncharacterized protein (TIGR01777 family)